MLVTFSSKAGADILMLAPHAKPLLMLLGKIDHKDLLTRGVVMPEHLLPAIDRLEQAIAAEPKQNTDDDQETDHPKDTRNLPVGLRQRAFPLLDLLRRAQELNVPVMWESSTGW